MSPFSTTMKRFSRSSSIRNSQAPQSPPTAFTSGPQTSAPYNTTSPTSAVAPPNRDSSLGPQGYMVVPRGAGTGSTGGVANESRPISSATDASFDFANRPLNSNSNAGAKMNSQSHHQQQLSTGGSGLGGLSRTDQIVLKHFWDDKYQENRKKDLHFLKFPFFPQYPSHRDLMPYCEIYHLVKTSPGATIISLGSANGVYIGFELQTGSQLHIDLDDSWFAPNPTPTSSSTHNNHPGSMSITHHRVSFRSFSSLLSDPRAESTVRTWPKPLTIEFLEELFQIWNTDLMGLCWESFEVGELGGGSGAGAGAGAGASSRGRQQQQHQQQQRQDHSVHDGNDGLGVGMPGGAVGDDVDDDDEHDHDHAHNENIRTSTAGAGRAE